MWMTVICFLWSVDCNAVEERLEKFTKVMEAAMSGSLAITNHELRDSQYMGRFLLTQFGAKSSKESLICPETS